MPKMRLSPARLSEQRANRKLLWSEAWACSFRFFSFDQTKGSGWIFDDPYLNIRPNISRQSRDYFRTKVLGAHFLNQFSAQWRAYISCWGIPNISFITTGVNWILLGGEWKVHWSNINLIRLRSCYTQGELWENKFGMFCWIHCMLTWFYEH